MIPICVCVYMYTVYPYHYIYYVCTRVCMYACMKVGICAYARMSVQSVRMQIRMYIQTINKYI